MTFDRSTMGGSLIDANLFLSVICDDVNSWRILPLCDRTSKHLIIVVYIRKVRHWLVQFIRGAFSKLSVTLSRRHNKVCRLKRRIICSCSQALLLLNWTLMPCAICEIITFSFFLSERNCDAITKQQQRVPIWRFFTSTWRVLYPPRLCLLFSCIMVMTSSSS